jgi:quinoprotein glucose dehydrogenase
MFRLFFSCFILFLHTNIAADLAHAPSKELSLDPKELTAEAAQKNIASFKTSTPLQISLWAANPHVHNPVAFSFDRLGRLFYVDHIRYHQGVEDDRSNMYWLYDDLNSNTINDRLNLINKWIALGKKEKNHFTKLQEHLWMVEDTNRDGLADQHQLVATYGNALDGIAAGVLAHDNKVYTTCIPTLWSYSNIDSRGKAQNSKSMFTGFGSKIAFHGHDMHGLKLGPDGRLYWNIGDRGYSVTTQEGKKLQDNGWGAVFRCELDGSNMEVYCIGMRNPMELVFDNDGNLFTVDNDGDGLDHARLHFLIPGGDYGWRIYGQYTPIMKLPESQPNQYEIAEHATAILRPWWNESLWDNAQKNTGLAIIPCIQEFSEGPSGLVKEPGTSLLNESFRNTYFLCDYRGSRENSALRQFNIKPNGSSFSLIDLGQPISNMMPTDVDFSNDGKLTFTDWAQGWKGGYGRIYQASSPDLTDSQIKAAQQTAVYLAEDLAKTNLNSLIERLSYADQRVRLLSQYEIAKRGKTAIEPLKQTLETAPILGQIHATWTLGHLARLKQPTEKILLDSLPKASPRLLAQLIKTLGDIPSTENISTTLIPYLKHTEPKVVLQTHYALASRGDLSAYEAILNMASTTTTDAFLRHSSAYALAKISKKLTSSPLHQAHHLPSADQRLLGVLALRINEDPAVANFLNDTDLRVQYESIRATHDTPFTQLYPNLAYISINLDSGVIPPSPLIHRILNANYHLGNVENLNMVIAQAQNKKLSQTLRIEAIRMLGSWQNPSPTDRVTGRVNHLVERKNPQFLPLIETAVKAIYATENATLKGEAMKVASTYRSDALSVIALQTFETPQTSAEERSIILEALTITGNESIKKQLPKLLSDSQPLIRAAALRSLSTFDRDQAATRAVSLLKSKDFNSISTAEAQAVIESIGLAEINKKNHHLEILNLIELAKKKQLRADIILDIKLMIEKRKSLKKYNFRLTNDFDQAWNQYEEVIKNDPIRKFEMCVQGGNAQEGKAVFFERADSQCTRCHIMDNQGSSLVGPNLTGIGARQKNQYLLEAIVYPSNALAKGFAMVNLELVDSSMEMGIVAEETDSEIKLSPIGVQIGSAPLKTIAKSQIKNRINAPSSMLPIFGEVLSKNDIRNLVEYLATSKP